MKKLIRAILSALGLGGIKKAVLAFLFALGLGTLLFIGLLVYLYVTFLGYDAQHFATIEQPIAFNHQTHAITNQISCEFCHTQARRSNSAGTPSVQTCVGCHIGIKGTTPEQQKQIAKILDYWKKNQPIPWKKIHDLPDFVHFSHQAHVKIGFDCTTCHGDVANAAMPVPQVLNKEVPLTMGWCMTCHRTDWPVDKNGKIALPKRAALGMAEIAPANHPVAVKNGPIDCLVCHK